VSAFVSAGRRFLPRGWADLGRQVAIWFAFLGAYQVARGVADRNPPRAFENGLHVIGIERHMNGLIELTLQRLVDGSEVLATAASWTYWNSEFTVLGLALLWVYLRRNGAFVRFRNAILLANVIGLVGYMLLPTAPPRMFPDLGFTDTLSEFGELNHGSGLIEFAANPYAAMPSLHAADALIVGLVLFSVCRTRLAKALWLLWPAWVWFSVMATGNHFWLDVVGGVLVAAVAGLFVYRNPLRRRAATA
jgi:membrane-associated phospholipid phosphatase